MTNIPSYYETTDPATGDVVRFTSFGIAEVFNTKQPVSQGRLAVYESVKEYYDACKIAIGFGKKIKDVGGEKSLTDSYVETYNFDVLYSKFKIRKSSKKTSFVEFNLEAFLKQPIVEHYVKNTIICAQHDRSFTKNFLKKEVAEWLKEKGYKLRQYYADINKGRLYSKIDLEFYDLRPFIHEYHNPPIWKTIRHVYAKCSFEIIPLN
jgi:hypothetical protein